MSMTPSKIGMTPPHPGAFIRDEILDELGLSVNLAAAILDVRRATLSDLVNGNAALSPEMALRVEKAFGVDMEMLLRMQAWADAVAMRSRSAEIHVERYRPPAESPTPETPVRRAATIDDFRPIKPPKPKRPSKAKATKTGKATSSVLAKQLKLAALAKRRRDAGKRPAKNVAKKRA